MAWNFKATAERKPGSVVPTKERRRNTQDYSAMIVRYARKYGIDPRVALKVARAEGGTKGYIQSRVKKGGRQEPSYGPFQLLVGGKGTGFPEGMGNQMIRETGLDPRDPANAEAAIDFAMKQASQHGWGQWYGAKAVGLSNFAGIGGRPASDAVASTGRAHGTGGAAIGAGVGDNMMAGDVSSDEMDFASLDLDVTDDELSLGADVDSDPIAEEEQTLQEALGLGGSNLFADVEFGADESAYAAALERSADTRDSILAMIANGAEQANSGAFLPTLPAFSI